MHGLVDITLTRSVVICFSQLYRASTESEDCQRHVTTICLTTYLARFHVKRRIGYAFKAVPMIIIDRSERDFLSMDATGTK